MVSDFAQRYADTYGVEPEQTIAEGKDIVDSLFDRGFDTDWVNGESRESFRRVSIKENGMEKYVAEHSDNFDHRTGEIRMPSEHASLWMCEILGQISDGAWENYWGSRDSPSTDYDAWKWYYNLEVVVDDDIDRVVITEEPPSRDMDISGRLTQYAPQIGRMAFILTAFDEDVTEEDVQNILDDFDTALNEA